MDTSKTNTTGQSRIQVTKTISASGSSCVFSPTIAGSTLGSFEMNCNVPHSDRTYMPASDQKPKRREIHDNQTFLRTNTSQLVQGVKSIALILDDLDLHDETKANVRAEKTDQQKMRRLLDFVNCESIAKMLVDTLFKHEGGLMKELTLKDL